MHRSELHKLERTKAGEALGRQFGVPAEQALFHSVVVHFENGQPIQVEDRHVNPRQVPQFAAQDFTQLQPSESLVRNVPFDQIEHVVDAVMPTAEQAALLELSPQEPCLLLTRRTWSRGVPITVVRCLHPATRYRLGSRFRADGNPVAG